MSALVSIRQLTLDATTARGTAHILRGIDLDIGKSRILGVVGESGSGKSSLASCLLRLLPANVSRVAGEIVFDGVDLIALSEPAMNAYRGARIAMIFQDPMTALNPLFTVGTHLRDVLRRRHAGMRPDEARRRSIAALSSVGIADAPLRLDSYPHQLSGGMRQRVMIAMALLVEPDLLLADEPTTALDATVEAQIVALFENLRRSFEGSIVFISHHLGLVAQLCDDLCVMYGGRVVESGPVTDVLSAPRHPYTRALLACELDDEAGGGRLVSIPGEVPDPVANEAACVFAPRCPYAAEVCLAGVPALREAGAGRRAACVRWETIEAEVGERVARVSVGATSSGGLVEFAGVSVVFDGKVRALDDVTLAIGKGEIVGLVGESGSGKSTLCRVLIGLTPPTSGSVKVGNRTVREQLAEKPLAFRRRAQLLLQDAVASLSPRMTIRRTLEEPIAIHALPHAEAQQRLDAIVKRLGLSADVLTKFPHQISGGQARRVGVARALVMRPEIIVADEPTAGLDVSVQGELLNLLLDLQREFGLTYLLVSHNLNVIRRVTERTAVMYLGQIVEDAGTRELFAKPAHPYCAALLSTNPAVDPKKRVPPIVLQGEIPSAVNPPSGCRFHTRCPVAQPKCTTDPPMLLPLDGGRRVRCHFPFSLAPQRH